MPSIDWETIGRSVLFSLTLWMLIRVGQEQFKLVHGIAKRKEAKRQGKNKVRRMFPEPPEPTERSRAREAMVRLVKQSARGLFDLLPEERCAGLLKRIAGAGSACHRCGCRQTEQSQDRHPAGN